MTLEQGAHLAEIVGVIVVVVTLIYLSVQVRQGTELLRSESRQAQVTNDQDGVYKFVEHPELGRLFSQVETPSFTEKTKLNFWLIGQMRAREHEWLQYRSGALDEETWLSYRDVIYFLLGTKRARELWELCNPFFNADYVEMVATMMDGVFWPLADVQFRRSESI
jgi:hypothetical protein